MSIRLNKLLARRGLGARRKCDALIQSGVVRVNGRVVTEPGTLVEPERDRVEVNRKPLPPAAEARYYMLHKPVGVISTLHDPEGRRTVGEFLPPGPRLFPVGRLDADTSGLLVLTNDGELAHRLMHPRYGVEKSYRVRLAAPPAPGQLRRLAEGVEFEPGVVSAPARARVVDPTPGRAMLALAMHEGRYRQVRRMCEAVGLTVVGLHRSAYGPLHLGDLPRGMWRELSASEVARLRAASARPHGAGRPPGRYQGVPRRGARERGERSGAGRTRPITSVRRASPYTGMRPRAAGGSGAPRFEHPGDSLHAPRGRRGRRERPASGRREARRRPRREGESARGPGRPGPIARGRAPQRPRGRRRGR